MKIKIIFIGFALAITFYSCEKTELEFSCDPEINEYVSKNKKSLADISLDQLSAYDISLQRAIFNSWEPSKKRDVWLEKLNNVLNKEELNLHERKHLTKLMDHIAPDYFSEAGSNHESTTSTYFAGEWISFAIKELNWNEEYIAFIVYRLYTKPEQFYQEKSAIASFTSSITTNTEAYDCNCNTSSDFCSTGACTSGDCNTVGGCGWLWSMECNGNCY